MANQLWHLISRFRFLLLAGFLLVIAGVGAFLFIRSRQPIPDSRGHTIPIQTSSNTTTNASASVGVSTSSGGDTHMSIHLSEGQPQPRLVQAVPLATLSQLSAADVPVKVDPPLPGTWRWLGTKTLTFSYNSDLIDRLPKATVYHVSVPAGTKSVTGGELAETVEWTFTTPPPKVIYTYPLGDSQPLDTLFFITFDQRIDPQAVLGSLEVSAGGRQVSVLAVSEAELKADEKYSWLVRDPTPGRWLAFKPASPLPADTQITVNVKKGTPSAEGPLTTTDDQT